MRTKDQKVKAVQSLAESLPSSTITVFTSFARPGEPGLTVAQMQELKRGLRAVQGEYVVAKKTLISKTLERLSYDGLDVFAVTGSVGLVLSRGDAYKVAKALYKFAKTNPALKLFGGWFQGQALTSEAVLALALLPTREELLAQLLGLMKYPLSSLAIVLNQISLKKSN